MRGNKWTGADRTSIGPGPAPARDRAEHRTCAPNGTALARVRLGRALVPRGSPPRRCPRGAGGDGDLAVHDQRGGRVVKSGVDAEHPQVISRGKSRQAAVAWLTVAERPAGRWRGGGDAWRTQRS